MAYSCYWQLLIHFLAILRMLGKTPLWNDVLINFAKGVKITSLICFITFFGMLLGPVLFLMLRSEIMSDISLHQ